MDTTQPLGDHQDKTTLEQVVLVPDHAPRTASALFEENRKAFLKQSPTNQCWICGATQPLEIHHLFEWSLWGKIDPDKMKAILDTLDIYGYSKEDQDKPIESPDDRRNLLTLCEKHHRGMFNGVHAITFPVWLAIKALKDGEEITPEEHQQIQQKNLSLQHPE